MKRSHKSDVGSFNILSFVDSTPYSTEGSPESGRTEGPDNILLAPDSVGEEEPQLHNRGDKSDDGRPVLKNETQADLDVSLDQYSNRTLQKKCQVPSDEEIDETKDDERSQPPTQFERDADPQSHDGS